MRDQVKEQVREQREVSDDGMQRFSWTVSKNRTPIRTQKYVPADCARSIRNKFTILALFCVGTFNIFKNH